MTNWNFKESTAALCW